MRLKLAALVAILLLAAACNGNGNDADADANANGDPAAGETARFVAVDLDFSEAPSSVAAGEVTIEIVNDGGMLHNVAIEELGGEVVASANAGESDTGTVTLEPGEYTAFCSVPGHRESGMEATFTAE
jgi:plastocyanin